MKRGERFSDKGITLICVRSAPESEIDSRFPFEKTQGKRGNDKRVRFAFVVGTGVDKRATKRNRVKRLMRESAQHVVPSMVSGMDCILIGSRALIGKTQQDVEKEVTTVLQKAKLLRS